MSSAKKNAPTPFAGQHDIFYCRVLKFGCLVLRVPENL